MSHDLKTNTQTPEFFFFFFKETYILPSSNFFNVKPSPYSIIHTNGEMQAIEQTKQSIVLLPLRT